MGYQIICGSCLNCGKDLSPVNYPAVKPEMGFICYSCSRKNQMQINKDEINIIENILLCKDVFLIEKSSVLNIQRAMDFFITSVSGKTAKSVSGLYEIGFNF